jgi:hypothetical protein
MVQWIFSASPRLRENIGFSPAETPVLSRRRGGAEECRAIRLSGFSVPPCLRERNALLISVETRFSHGDTKTRGGRGTWFSGFSPRLRENIGFRVCGFP